MNSDTTAQFDLKQLARRAMLDRGLLPDFSPEARTQAEGLQQPASSSNSAVRDLRDLLWASIDNDDSRDLDQLSVAEPLASGHVKVLVAIADVEATVAVGSPIDAHASTNTTSVYTAAGVFPMLPEKLSTNLTSLGEGQDRLSVVVEMTVDPEGSLTQSDLYRALVRNQAKLAYRSVAAWLDGKGPTPERFAAVRGLDQQIRLQDKVAQALKKVRETRGSLSLQTIEAEPVFDNGLLNDLRADDKDRAQDLIEDFMIAANEVSARFLEAKGVPSIRRVLREPKRWDRIVALAGELGERLPATADGIALNAFLVKRREADPVRFPDLSLSVVKLLGSGQYVLELPGEHAEGHFGLAVRDYTHSTAPNRRFPDLITQRLLKAALEQKPSPYSVDQLRALADHCTQQEGNAAKVERQVRKSAAAMLLASRIGQRFNAIVTGASEKGTWVRISQPPVEGRVVRGFRGLDVGDRVDVKLVSTDPGRGFIDFARQ
jgi:VacB/RNase II family 3'-5' exoribonuclease